MVGVFYNYLADLAQRKTFSQTRRYLISLTTIEEQKIKKVTSGHAVISFLGTFGCNVYRIGY
jgi:hypothetical protein